ncbi:MAG: alpha-hydroxy-acid oxidizing protein [Acidobacteriota bacterium]|nr:alpha-hydroxy-acid oxidizing protein [Acidobacteriota bacterium]
MEYEAIARTRMEASAYDYYAGAAGDERTLAENRRGFDRLLLRPRVLVDVSRVDTATTLLGESLALPILLAPTAFNRLAHPDGECAVVRAAGRAGTLLVASTIASCSVEEIAAAATGPLWFQLYVYKDRELTKALVARAEAAGCRALVLTVDTPRLGRRERDVRNGFVLPPHAAIRNFADVGRATEAGWTSGSSFFDYVFRLFDASLGWEAIDWLQSITRLPVLLKGILTPEDARLAADAGVAGIVVSNHGARQLDGVAATIDALPAIVGAVDGRLPVLLDGGIRRGTDVLKALALGARAVLIGRPYLWALAADGEAGVSRALALLRDELELAMALAGRPTIASIDASLVERGPFWL